MFRLLFQVLIFTALIYIAYDFIAGNKAQSWSYCGDAVKQEKKKMETEVRQLMRDIGTSAEVTWKEDAKCISASVKNNGKLSSILVNKAKEYF